jgi:hypothetical protein
MLRSTIRSVRELLDGERVLSLAVVVEGKPYAGLLPFAALPDCTGVLIHASRLARHSQGLADGAVVGILVHERDTPDKDPLQIKRASFECVVHPLERNSDEWSAARDRYVEQFPESRITFGLGDFTLHRLEFRQGIWIGGFGKAIEIRPADIGKLATLLD